MKNFLTKFKNPKLLALIGFVVVLIIGLPLAVYLTQQPTHINQNASFTGDQFDSCGNIQVSASEIPQACISNKVQPGMTSHSSVLTLTLVKKLGTGNKIIINWKGISYFCPTHASLTGSNAGCYLDPKPASTTACTLDDEHTTCQIAVNQHTPPAPYAGLACGYYQDDYAFQYAAGSFGGTGCHYGDYNFISDNGQPGGALFCNAGDCVIATPTPTPFATSTPTPPITPTDTPAVTDTPTPTPTEITPTPTISDTPTPGPSITPTPTPNPSATPTPTNNPTPTDTPTPGTTIIVQNVTATPVPTLPSTGPNNTFINLGIVGSILGIIGTVILFTL